MVRRSALLVSALAFVLLACGVQAQSLYASVKAQLRDQGYRDIETSQTLLGRARFEARKGDRVRVIVINPSTGEILRDLSRKAGAKERAGLVELLGDAIFGGGGDDGDDVADGDADGGGDDAGDGDADGDGGDSDGDGDGDGDGGDGDGGDGGDGDGGDGDGD